MSRQLETEAGRVAVHATWDEPTLRWATDGENTEVSLRQVGPTTLLLSRDGEQSRVRFARRGPDVFLLLDGRTVHLKAAGEDADESAGSSSNDPVVRAPMPGKVVAVLVAAGDAVTAGQAVVRVEAMKMEVDLAAAVNGTVQTVHVDADDVVDVDAALVTLEPTEES